MLGSAPHPLIVVSEECTGACKVEEVVLVAYVPIVYTMLQYSFFWEGGWLMGRRFIVRGGDYRCKTALHGVPC